MTRATNQSNADRDLHDYSPETTVVEAFADTLVGSREGVGVAACRKLRGLALRIVERNEAEPGADEYFEIAAIDAHGGSSLVLGQYLEDEVVAVWRRLGAATGLPLMLQNPDGSLLEPYPQIGQVQLGAVHSRRRYGLLRQRRPRFLTRRKVGNQTSRPVVFREHEIIARPKG
jgi:hypothetical protein